MSQPIPPILTQEMIDQENALIFDWDNELIKNEYDSNCKDLDEVYSVCNSLKGILENNAVFEHLRQYMWKERTEENYIFWSDVENYKKTYNENKDTDYEKIWGCINYIMSAYFFENCRYELFVPYSYVEELCEKYKEISSVDHTTTLPPIDFFDNIQKIIFELIQRTSYQKFVRQDGIKGKLALTAQHVVLKHGRE